VDGFFERLKRRKLMQWALAYAAAAFALLQGVDIVAQRFGWPESIERGLIVALAVGFLVTIVLAWYHGERGAQHVAGSELLILTLLLAIGGGLLWRMAEVPQHAAAPDVAKPATTLSTPIPDKSIAVLPLTNESGEKDQQYFSDGLSEDLITALSQFAGLKVIGRNSSFQFRDTKLPSAALGQALGVAHLLEGSVRRAGDVVRISAMLVNAADGSTVWSQHYDRAYKDLFALQDDITKHVASALKAKLLTGESAPAQSDRPPSGNLEAYTAFLQGKFYAARFIEADDREAIAQFTEATRLDPRYALAWAELSHSATGMAARFLDGERAQQVYALARRAAATALQLAPDLAAAHGALAYVRLTADFDWDGAEAEYRRGLELAPNDGNAKFGLGEVLAALGRPEQAVELTRQALATDPLNPRWHAFLAQYLSALGLQDEARKAILKAIALQPGGSATHEQLTIIEILRGDAKAALIEAKQEPPGPWQDIALAMARQVGGDAAVADAAVKDVAEKHATLVAYQIAEIYALRNDAEKTFEWLDRAWSSRDPGIEYLLTDPLILRFRDDPRFAAFCKQLGLPATTTAKAMDVPGAKANKS